MTGLPPESRESARTSPRCFRNGVRAHEFPLPRSEEHTSELQSHVNLVCRLLLEKKNEAPYLFPKARFGARMGNAELIDSLVHDGLWSTFTCQHMAQSSEDVTQELELNRAYPARA